MKDARINIRLEQEDKDKLIQLAKQKGLTITELIVQELLTPKNDPYSYLTYLK